MYLEVKCGVFFSTLFLFVYLFIHLFTGFYFFMSIFICNIGDFIVTFSYMHSSKQGGLEEIGYRVQEHTRNRKEI
jgi:hypothetical protein